MQCSAQAMAIWGHGGSKQFLNVNPMRGGRASTHPIVGLDETETAVVPAEGGALEAASAADGGAIALIVFATAAVVAAAAVVLPRAILVRHDDGIGEPCFPECLPGESVRAEIKSAVSASTRVEGEPPRSKGMRRIERRRANTTND